jgi:TolA-binding protein
VGDLAAVEQATGRILQEFPGSYLTEAALTLQGQALARHANPRAAREIFLSVLKKFPDTAKRADLQLAITRTYELEGDWKTAAELHRQWLEAFPDHPLRPQVEFALGWALARTGDTAGALQTFTNFVARYTNQPLAARAQWWVADHYFNLGPSAFMDAERQYQLLATVWSNHPLAYEARMMAGRVAMARQAWLDAIGYFTNLTSDLRCPVPLKIQALFAYGDAVRRLPSTDTNTPLANFEEAARIFAKVLDLEPTNAAAARAWGEMGECYLQLAARDPTFYIAASNAFHQALALPAADLPTRCQAWMGLGLVNERLGARLDEPQRGHLLREAMDRYVDVLYGRPLRPGESPDPFWTRRAGLEAARLAESLQEWRQALRIYERLRELLPPLQPALEKRMERLRERIAATSAGE